jgi:hypothetical protein
VEGEGKEASLAEPFDEWQVHVAYVLLEDVIEVPHRLVEMDAEDEAQRVQLGALCEAEPPPHVARGVRAEPEQLGLNVERDVQALELEQVGQVDDRAGGRS